MRLLHTTDDAQPPVFLLPLLKHLGESLAAQLEEQRSQRRGQT